MWRCLSLLPVIFSLASAAPQDYFPLQTGNQWIYRASKFGQTLVAEITETAWANGNQYYVLTGLGPDTWLRMSAEGTLYAYNPETKTEGVWAAFATPEGQSYRSTIDTCSPTGKVSSHAFHAVLPIGEFDTLFAIDYPPARCADAGLTNELYLAYIGLVRRIQTSIAGPVTYDLVYARLGGVTVVTAPELSFTASVVPPGLVRMALRNTGPDPVTLTYPSGQRFDVVLRNDKGDAVYQWSRGRLFTAMVGTLAVAGEKNFVVDLPLASIPSGRYTVEAWLTTTPIVYRAQTSINVP
jgi:hypothetical protein